MRLKLFKRFFLTISLIILISLSIMVIILMIVFNNYIASDNFKTLDRSCTTVSELIKNDSVQDSEKPEYDIYNVIHGLSDVSDTEIFITDNNGGVRICSCGEWEENGTCDTARSLIAEKYLKIADKDGKFGLNTIGIYQSPHYVSARPLYDSDGTKVGYLFATAPLSTAKNLMITIFRLCALSAVIPIIVMFFAIYAMTYRLTRPLRLMSEASRAMARGDFSRRIPVTSDDEIGELAIAFNQMTNSLVHLEGMRRSFVANVSHELKTPMTTIGGFIDGIIDGTIEPEKQKYYLGIVSGEVKRLSRLVQSMLSLSKLESGEFVLKPQQFDFGALLLDVVVSQEQRIENAGIDICGLDEIPSITLSADKDLIHQVVYNLLDNAVKFTDSGGVISFAARAAGKRLVFTISNTGAGIPADQLPHVFERFYKADRSRSARKDSTGLGLYIVQTIVKIHGGSIQVSSKENVLTTFEVTLPLK